MSHFDDPVSLGYSDGKASPDAGGGSEGCPTITLHCPEALAIPEHFLVTFKGERGQRILKSASRSEKASCTVVLHLHKLCEVEEAEPEELDHEEDETRDSPIDRLFEKAEQEQPEEE
jgi:hypothetical protein